MCSFYFVPNALQILTWVILVKFTIPMLKDENSHNKHFHYSHFIDGETKTKRGEISCPPPCILEPSHLLLKLLWLGCGLSVSPKVSYTGTLVPSVVLVRGDGTLGGGASWG